MGRMVQHKSRVTRLMGNDDWIRYSTLCGRMNRQSIDGMNIAATDDGVSCKFCLNLMAKADIDAIARRLGMSA